MRVVAISDGTWPDYDGYRIKFYDITDTNVSRAVRKIFDEGAKEVLLRHNKALKMVTRANGNLSAKVIRSHKLAGYLTAYLVKGVAAEV